MVGRHPGDEESDVGARRVQEVAQGQEHVDEVDCAGGGGHDGDVWDGEVGKKCRDDLCKVISSVRASCCSRGSILREALVLITGEMSEPIPSQAATLSFWTLVLPPVPGRSMEIIRTPFSFARMSISPTATQRPPSMAIIHG